MAGVNLYNLARMTTATVGAGAITLNAAVPGFLSFAQAGIADGQSFRYGIADGNSSEVGVGVYTAAGTTMTRTVKNSTNGNAAISLSGSAQVFITALAEDFPFQVDSGGATATLKAAITSLVIGAAVSIVSASFGLSGNISQAAWGTAGVRFTNVAATFTDTSTAASGTVAAAYTNVFGGSTIAATNASVVYTDYYNTYFKDPIAGTNITLTNKWAVGADSLAIGNSLSTRFQVSNAGVLSWGAVDYTLTHTTGLLTASGALTVGGVGLFGDGTVSLPGISFGSDTDTGVYRIGANNIGVAVNATKILDIATTGLTVTGTITGTGNLNLSTNKSQFLVNSFTVLSADSSNQSTFIASSGNTSQTGTSNLGFGIYAMFTITSGSYNVAIGQSALGNETTASSNVAVGLQALAAQAGGSGNNVGIGATAGSAVTTGSYNVLVGSGAGQGLTSGAYNTIVGAATIGTGILTSGNYNTIIGAGISFSNGAFSNTIIIADGQGNIRIDYGKTTTSQWTVGGGHLAFNTAANTIVLKRGANGSCGTFVANGATPVTVSNSNIAITDTISISINTVGGTVGVQPHVATITAGVGFTVVCTAVDSSTYNYAIIKNQA